MEEGQLNVFEQAKIVDTWRNPNSTNIQKVSEELELLLQIKELRFQDLCLQFANFAQIDPLIFHFSMNIKTEKLKGLMDGTKTEGKLSSDFDKLASEPKEEVKKIFNARCSSEQEMVDFCKKDLAYLSKFPFLMKTAIEYEHSRLEEFLQVSKNMLSKIKQVQCGEIDIHQCSDDILQGDLATRFYKKK